MGRNGNPGRDRSGIVLCLGSETRLAKHRDTVRIQVRGRELSFPAVPPGALAAFRRLAGSGASRIALARTAGRREAARWASTLAELESACAVSYEVRDSKGLLARLVPMAPEYRDSFGRTTTNRMVLSRFVCIRRVRDGLVLESPLAHARVELSARAAPHLGRFLVGRPGRETAPGGLASLLLAAGMLTGVDRTGRSLEERDPTLRTWEFADLLFHSRSRLGRHDAPAGAALERVGRLAPLPALKPAITRRGGGVALPRPDLERVARRDPPLTRALELRRSVREGSDGEVTLAELGEFLYRVARVRGRKRANARLPYETTSRPYPSGGACYPLELYLAVSRCEDLPRGFYHYDPLRHRLEPVAGGESQVEPLLRDTRQEFGPVPPILIVITARFARMAWKYRSMAYSVLLKDVGVLMQTMYLVATAMGLAPCAIGCGDAERSVRALGTRFEAESSVGEFLLAKPRKNGRHGR